MWAGDLQILMHALICCETQPQSYINLCTVLLNEASVHMSLTKEQKQARSELPTLTQPLASDHMQAFDNCCLRSCCQSRVYMQ